MVSLGSYSGYYTRELSPTMHSFSLRRLTILYEVIGPLGSVLEIRENLGFEIVCKASRHGRHTCDGLVQYNSLALTPHSLLNAEGKKSRSLGSRDMASIANVEHEYCMKCGI